MKKFVTICLVVILLTAHVNAQETLFSVDFRNPTIISDGISITTGTGFVYNSTYGNSWRMLYPGTSFFRGSFHVETVSDMELTVTHLSSGAGGCPGGGYSPVDIVINDSDTNPFNETDLLQNNYDVAENHGYSHGFQTDTFVVPSDMICPGWNTITFAFENDPWACTHYWIQEMSAVPITPPSEFVPDLDTVALWHLNGNGNDASGNGNNLIVKSDRVFWVPGKFCLCAEMGVDPWSGGCENSDGAALTAPGAGCTYPGSGDWTIEAWVQFPSNTAGYYAISHYSKHWAGHDPYHLGITNGEAYFLIEEGDGAEYAAIIYADVSCYVGQWVHLAGVYRDRHSIELYINGVRAAHESTILAPEYLPNFDVFVGGSYCGTSTCLKVDEVRISNVARYSDINNLMNVSIGRIGYDRRTGQFSVSVTVENISAEDIGEPVWLVIESISNPGVTVANADGTTCDGKSYIDLSTLLSDGQLAPGESVVTRIYFNNPSRVRFTFVPSVRGVVLP